MKKNYFNPQTQVELVIMTAGICQVASPTGINLNDLEPLNNTDF